MRWISMCLWKRLQTSYPCNSSQLCLVVQEFPLLAQADLSKLKRTNVFLKASASFWRPAKARWDLLKCRSRGQTCQSSLRCHSGPVSSAGFFSQSTVWSWENQDIHVTFSHLKQWKRHSIDHCYGGSDGKQLWDAGMKCGRCANHSSSRPATRSPGLGKHQPKCFYSPSLLCSEVKTFILLPWLPLPLLSHTSSVSGRKQNAFKKEREKGR